jgi:hypothetical protein
MWNVRVEIKGMWGRTCVFARKLVTGEQALATMN